MPPDQSHGTQAHKELGARCLPPHLLLCFKSKGSPIEAVEFIWFDSCSTWLRYDPPVELLVFF